MFKLIIAGLIFCSSSFGASSAINGLLVGVTSTSSTAWAAYTPTITGYGTVTNVSFLWRRIGDTLEVIGTFTTGTTAASLATFTLPTSPAVLAIDSAKLPINNTDTNPGVEIGTISASAANQYGLIVTATGSSTALVYQGSGVTLANHLTPGDGNVLVASSAHISVKFSVPISGWTNIN